MKSRRTKALEISRETKARVFIRDGGCCVYCGSPRGEPNAHFVARSQGGLGIEENILTLCPEHHRAFDQTPARKKMGEYFRQYLKNIYPDWDEENLYYKKYTED